jgi:hypothetical protein
MARVDGIAATASLRADAVAYVAKRNLPELRRLLAP